MARFYQQVKTLISDIEKFLNVAIKDSKIPKAAQAQKASIIGQINELRNDYPQLETSDEQTQQHTHAPEPVPEESDDLYEDTDTALAAIRALDREDVLKKDVPATDTQNVIHSGLMKLRKDKKSNFMSKLTKLKQFGVLRDDIFYIYEKKTSKKQTECFSIKGYTVTSLEDDTKKEPVFEMTHDDKKAYIIEVGSHDDLENWLSKLNESPYTASAPNVSKNKDTSLQEDDDDLYEDTDALTGRVAPVVSTSDSPPPLPKSAHPPRPTADTSGPPPALPARSLPPPVPAPDDDDQIYEEGDVDANTSPSPSGESLPKSNTPNNDDQDIYDETAPADFPPPPEDDSQDIYDETVVTETPPQASQASPVKNKSSLFSSSLQVQSKRLDSPQSSFRKPGVLPPPPKKSLPPPPTRPKNGTTAPPVTDYENMFYGVWDCASDQEKELSFRRGDIITVVNRKYDDRGWWVGRLHEKVGLVPKDFLSPAYERA